MDKGKPVNRTKRATSIRLTSEARRLLLILATRRGISQAAVLEQLIRDEAERRGIPTQAPNESD